MVETAWLSQSMVLIFMPLAAAESTACMLSSINTCSAETNKATGIVMFTLINARSCFELLCRLQQSASTQPQGSQGNSSTCGTAPSAPSQLLLEAPTC